VAVKTRISPTYIQALEENRLDSFPGEVFARGFVRVYGRCLGLDDPDTMTRFTQSAQAFFRARDEKKRSTAQSAEQDKVRKERRSRIIQVTFVAVLGLTILTVYGINSRHLKDVEEAAGPVPTPPTETAIPAEPQPDLTEPAVNQPALKEAESAKPDNSPPLSSGPAAGPPKPPAAQTPPPEPSVKPEEKVPLIVNVPGLTAELPARVEALVLVIEAVESSWVSAKIDGGGTKEVYLERGEKVTWKASDHFVVSFGNAGGVKVQFNGKSLPPFGPKGAVMKDVRIARE
jgi:cytoskeleton protein RodZ